MCIAFCGPVYQFLIGFLIFIFFNLIKFILNFISFHYYNFYLSLVTIMGKMINYIYNLLASIEIRF